MAELVTRTPGPPEPHFHLAEPLRGGQDPGPGQDLRLLPRHGATSKTQHGNQSAGNCSCAEPLPTAGAGQPGKLPSLCAYPVVDAPCAVPGTVPNKRAVEMHIFLPLLWRWDTCQPQLCKGPQCGTPLPGRCLATSPRSPWLYDPCGQGARQLLSSAGSCPRGRFVCWRWKPRAQLGWLC